MRLDRAKDSERVSTAREAWKKRKARLRDSIMTRYRNKSAVMKDYDGERQEICTQPSLGTYHERITSSLKVSQHRALLGLMENEPLHVLLQE